MAFVPVTLRLPRDYENPLCAEVSPTFFYIDDVDEQDSDTSQKTYNEAAEICKNCSHIEECAEWGIRNERHGFWGGLSPHDRIAIRRKRKITLSNRY